MVIVVVGFPGVRVEQTLTNARAAASEFDARPTIKHVMDVYEIIRMRNVSTPTLLVNAEIKSSGRIPSVFEIASWIEETMAEEALRNDVNEEVAA